MSYLQIREAVTKRNSAHGVARWTHVQMAIHSNRRKGKRSYCFQFYYILSRIRGCVTNNCEF
jgi:hypothetical protein